MASSEKMETISNIIELNKGMILALLSGNVGKYEFLTDKDVLP